MNNIIISQNEHEFINADYEKKLQKNRLSWKHMPEADNVIKLYNVWNPSEEEFTKHVKILWQEEIITWKQVSTFIWTVASGKWTLVKQIAANFDGIYIDSGSFFRSVAYFFDKLGYQCDEKWFYKNGDMVDLGEIKDIIKNIDIKSITSKENDKIINKLYINKEDISDIIRTAKVWNIVPNFGKNPDVRWLVTELINQAMMQSDKNLVMLEWREYWNFAYNYAICKLYFDAEFLERVYRNSWRNGNNVYESAKGIFDRDSADINRWLFPVRIPKWNNSFIVNTSNWVEKPNIRQEKIINAVNKTLYNTIK